MPNTSVFQRIEKKYRISAATRQALEGALASRLCHSPARDGMVTSIYLDTPDHHLIGRSLEKPPYKEKLRLRAYGIAWRQLIAPDESIMEVKAAGAFPLWLAHLLDEAHAYPQSFSKCGAAARVAFAHPARKEGATHA